MVRLGTEQVAATGMLLLLVRPGVRRVRDPLEEVRRWLVGSSSDQKKIPVMWKIPVIRTLGSMVEGLLRHTMHDATLVIGLCFYD